MLINSSSTIPDGCSTEWFFDVLYHNKHCIDFPLCFYPTGKSMLLSAIGHREIPIPEHIDIYHLTREMAPSDKTALQCVMEVDEARIMLEKEAERLAHEDCE